MGIARPVMEAHPWAWAFFVPFILVSTFTVLNLFIAIMVDAMQSIEDEQLARTEAHIDRSLQAENAALHEELGQMAGQLAQLQQGVEALQKRLKSR